jgi:hypothetical protein
MTDGSAAARAIHAVAAYAREHSSVYVGDASLPSEYEKQRRQKEVEEVAGELDKLAGCHDIRYADFDGLLVRLHRVSFYPRNGLVSAVARALAQK